MPTLTTRGARRLTVSTGAMLLIAAAFLQPILGGDGGGDGNGGDPLTILPPDGPRAASTLSSVPGCDTEAINRGQVLLNWRLAKQPGTEQLVQVTIFREGFDNGRFVLSRPLSGTESSLRFDQVAGQALHRWRVLTLHSDGYVPSETMRFTGPICIFDEGEGGQNVPG